MTAATLELENVLRGRQRSKHRQFDADGKWIPGRVRINDNSRLRKLMRAARRGMVPAERARTIVGAMMTSERGKAHRWQRVAEAQRKALLAQAAAAS